LTAPNPLSRPYAKGVKRNKKKAVYMPARPSMSARFKELWADPVWRAKQMLLLEGKRGRTPGLPDGMRKPEFLKLKALAEIKTKKVLAAMAKTDEFEPDNKVANAAIEACVEVLNMPGSIVTRMQAAKTLLEYTQRKPQTASQVTLKTAEDFLDQIVADDTSADSNS
jgi:predicted alpha/beta-hydrolase family hydrolase